MYVVSITTLTVSKNYYIFSIGTCLLSRKDRGRREQANASGPVKARKEVRTVKMLDSCGRNQYRIL